MMTATLSGLAPPRLSSPDFGQRAGSVLSTRSEPLVVLSVRADQMRSMQRSIPVLLRNARRQLAGRRNRASKVEVVLDLSRVPSMPSCAPLLALVGLLRRVAGPASRITVTGVTPTLRAGLIDSLPASVTLVDQTGCRW
jgi:hypothetical protein